MRRTALTAVMFIVVAAVGDRFTDLRGHMRWLVAVELLVVTVLGLARHGSRDTEIKPPPT